MLKGEITSKSRPENSTLEADIDYERQIPSAPLITTESNLSLEEMIKVLYIFNYIEKNIRRILG